MIAIMILRRRKTLFDTKGGTSLENVKGKRVITSFVLLSILGRIYYTFIEIRRWLGLNLDYFSSDSWLDLIIQYSLPIAVEVIFAVYIFMRMKHKKCDRVLLMAIGAIVLQVIIICLYSVYRDGSYVIKQDGFFSDYSIPRGIIGMGWIAPYGGPVVFVTEIPLLIMLGAGFAGLIRGKKKLMAIVLGWFSVNKIIMVISRFARTFSYYYDGRQTIYEVLRIFVWWLKYYSIADVMFFAAIIIFLLKNDIPNVYLNVKKDKRKLSREKEYGALKSDYENKLIEKEEFEALKKELFLRV